MTIAQDLEIASPTVSPTELRRAAGQFATGITIVTVAGPHGLHGMTANSFTSVSLDPPLLLVSVDLRRRTHGLLERAERFAVSVLSEAHRELSGRFAGQQGEQRQEDFTDVPHTLTADGTPLISGALAHFVCRRVAIYPAGDHSLFLGQVEDLSYQPGLAPLLYFGGRYHVIGEQR
jgi:flavin reductase (DIM6/NTAB) family NADH-FMN oxidoreductase RutF